MWQDYPDGLLGAWSVMRPPRAEPGPPTKHASSLPLPPSRRRLGFLERLTAPRTRTKVSMPVSPRGAPQGQPEHLSYRCSARTPLTRSYQGSPQLFSNSS